MSYWRYWGKASPGEHDQPCHLLPFHCLDVAAVGWQLLAPERALTRHMAQRFDMPSAELRQWLVFALGLHDIGKFARAFQGLASPAGVDLVRSAGLSYSERHDVLGAVLWGHHHLQWMRQGILGGSSERISEENARRAYTQANDCLMTPVLGHHGQPVSEIGNGSVRIRVESHFVADTDGDDIAVARQFIADWAALVGLEWPVSYMVQPRFSARLAELSWTLAGWSILCDWLGSNRDWFPYHSQRLDLDKYWQYALSRARQALASAGLGTPPQPQPYTGLASLLGGEKATPTPLQQLVEEIALADGAQMYVLEDVTGAGKTEAACILAQRLLNAGHGEGIYFALPTMATSNAMYQRMGPLHQHFFTARSQPSLVLAHGASRLNQAFQQSLVIAPPDERDYAAGDQSAGSGCAAWLADSRKKALLADVGVGTLDQALIGVLPLRHQSLRLYGLARKVLIVDEVHAFDTYTLKLLGTLLTHHARQGGSAIILTATLPMATRAELADAWREGLGCGGQVLEKQDFPLLTQVSATNRPVEKKVETRREVVRDVAIAWLEDEAVAIDAVLAAVEQGDSVAWVRNSVDDALEAFAAIRQRHPEPQRCLLFHSRFTLLDRRRIEQQVLDTLGKHSTSETRRSRVIVATQVFQESLDCDVDCMISDLAPIDLLIQRAGRLQRHSRGKRVAPCLQVLAPQWADDPDADWLRRVLPRSQAVYTDTSLSWLTQKVLRECGGISMPGQARRLIEGVYAANADDLPPALDQARAEASGDRQHRRSMADYNALELALGYRRGIAGDWEQDIEIGTRYSDEPSETVVVLRVDQGALRLWAEGETGADMLSQIRLRHSQAQRLAALPDVWQPQWQELVLRYRALKYMRPWLVESGAAQSQYCAERGLVLSLKAQ